MMNGEILKEVDAKSDTAYNGHRRKSAEDKDRRAFYDSTSWRSVYI